MGQWWAGLNSMTQSFYIAAAFFSVIFIWQFLMAVIGMGGDSDAEMDTDHDFDTAEDVDGVETDGHDAAESMAAFKILSLRSVLAFCMLFSWAGALYLQAGKTVGMALLYATIWGAIGMILVATTLYLLRKMAHTGTMKLSGAVGKTAMVYLDIPAGGQGEIRVMIGERIENVKARCRDTEKSLSAGEEVKIISLAGGDVFIVE